MQSIRHSLQVTAPAANIDQSVGSTVDSASIAIAVVMCGGIVARTSRTRKSLGFLLLLFSIARLPLLRHADAKILRGDLVTSEVITNGFISDLESRESFVICAPSFDPSGLIYI